MPEFIAQHVPSKGLDEFTTGYLEACEWLLDDETDRDEIAGFDPSAIATATTDCAGFQTANADDLDAYQEASGRDLHGAGVDFWLSRNGHGAGYFDRGDDPCFDRLQDAAEVYGTCDAYIGDDKRVYLS